MEFTRKPLKQYKYLTFLTMLYMTVYIVCVTVGYRMVNFFGIEIPLCGLVIPFLLVLGDITAEAYGYHTTMKIIFSSIVCQLLFGILITIALKAPSPLGNTNNIHYNLAFEHIIRTNITSVFSVTAGMFTNSFLISRLKIQMHGKRFWLRSILASGFSELILCIVAYVILFVGFKSISEITKIILIAWLYRLIIAVLMAPICAIVGFLLKNSEKSDVYDTNINYFSFNKKNIITAKIAANDLQLNDSELNIVSSITSFINYDSIPEK